MLKLSNQSDYTLCSQYDTALDIPQLGELPADADQAAIDAHRAAIVARDQKLKAARERGGDEWVKLTRPNSSPTLFNFRQVPGPAVSWWRNEVRLRRLNEELAVELLFRLALSSVENLGTYKVEWGVEDGHRILTLDSLATIYAVGNGLGELVVFELGMIVLGKTVQRVGPLSSGG